MAMFPEMVVDTTAPQEYCRKIATFLHGCPAAWTQGVSARTANGIPIHPNHSLAARWCMLGMLERFVPTFAGRMQVLQLLSRAISIREGRPRVVHHYNDKPTRTIEDIVAVLELASHLECVPGFDYEKFAHSHSMVKADLFAMSMSAEPPVCMPPHASPLTPPTPAALLSAVAA